MNEQKVPPRIAYVSLGCRTNRVEIDAIASVLARNGCVLCEETEADAIVINTCAVTGEAEAKTRKALRHAAALPQAPAVIATGCVATLFADSLREAAPNVIVEPDKSQVARRVLEALDATARNCIHSVHPLRSVTPTGRTRPGIKIQDGCDLRCTYCIVWKARGPARSLPFSQVLAALHEALDAGAHEVVLSGINVGTYRDPTVGNLSGLLRTLLAVSDVGRVRLSSIEPPDVTDELLETMAQAAGRIAPFLHVCLQSGCDTTLTHMGRPYRTAYFRDVVTSARNAIPGIALGTDLIVGFPGETERHFEESLAFCQSIGFSRMHVFRYSRRPGTPAAEAKGQLDPAVIAARAQRMRSLAEQLKRDAAQAQIGSQQLVCIQAAGRGVTGTLFDALVDTQLPVGELINLTIDGVCSDGTTLRASTP